MKKSTKLLTDLSTILNNYSELEDKLKRKDATLARKNEQLAKLKAAAGLGSNELAQEKMELYKSKMVYFQSQLSDIAVLAWNTRSATPKDTLRKVSIKLDNLNESIKKFL